MGGTAQRQQSPHPGWQQQHTRLAALTLRTGQRRAKQPCLNNREQVFPEILLKGKWQMQENVAWVYQKLLVSD